MLDDSQWSHKAWMSQIDADLLERVVLRQGRAAPAPLRVLEWGSGRSTLYFTDRLQTEGVAHQWLTLEYDRAFFEEALAPSLAGRAHSQVIRPDAPGGSAAAQPPAPGQSALTCVVFDRGRLLPYLAGHEADRLVDLDDYVNYPATLDTKFDLIIVDGRKRRRCLLAAAELLRPGGLVVLHDAYRTYYQCAFSRYASQRMLGEILWIGSQEQTNFLQWIA